MSLGSPCQRSQKLLPAHVVLERLPSIYKNDGDLIVVSVPQFGREIDIDLAPLEIGLALNLSQSLFHYIAQMTSLPRIHHHFVHKVIVSA